MKSRKTDDTSAKDRSSGPDRWGKVTLNSSSSWDRERSLCGMLLRPRDREGRQGVRPRGVAFPHTPLSAPASTDLVLLIRVRELQLTIPLPQTFQQISIQYYIVLLRRWKSSQLFLLAIDTEQDLLPVLLQGQTSRETIPTNSFWNTLFLAIRNILAFEHFKLPPFWNGLNGFDH